MYLSVKLRISIGSSSNDSGALKVGLVTSVGLATMGSSSPVVEKMSLFSAWGSSAFACPPF